MTGVLGAMDILAPGPPKLVYQLNVSLPAELRDIIKQLADRAGVSQSEVCRRLMQDAVKRLFTDTTGMRPL